MQFVFCTRFIKCYDLNARNRRTKEQEQFVGAIVTDCH